MRASVALISILSLACDLTEPAPASTDLAPTHTIAGEACGKAKAEELAKVLREGCTTSPVDDPRVLATAKWKATHRGSLDGVSIVVTASGATVQGRPFEDIWLPDMLERKRSDPAFVLAIHGDARLPNVQLVLAELVAAKATRGVLLFASGTEPHTLAALHPEIYARLSEKVDATSADQRAISIARELETLIASCQPVIEAFQAVATHAQAERCELLTSTVAQGIVDCNCPSWTPELVTWLQVMSGPVDAPRIHADDVTLDPERGISAEPSATWSSLVAQHDAPIDKLWLAP